MIVDRSRITGMHEDTCIHQLMYSHMVIRRRCYRVRALIGMCWACPFSSAWGLVVALGGGERRAGMVCMRVVSALSVTVRLSEFPNVKRGCDLVPQSHCSLVSGSISLGVGRT